MTLEELIKSTPLNYDMVNITKDEKFSEYLNYSRDEIAAALYSQKRYDLLISNEYVNRLSFKEQIETCDAIGYIPPSLILEENIFNYYIENNNYFMASYSICCYSSDKLPEIRKYIADNLNNLPSDLFSNLDDKAYFIILLEILENNRYDLIEDHISDILDSIVYNTHIVPMIIRSNEYLFNKALETDDVELILCFSDTLITNEYIEKHREIIYDVLSMNPNMIRFLSSNKSIYNIIFSKKRFDLLIRFDSELLEEEQLSNYTKEIIEALETMSYFPGNLRTNKTLFNIVVKAKKTKLLLEFDASLFTPEIFTEFESEIISLITENREYTYRDNSFLFNELIKRNRFDLLINFNNDLLTDEIITKYLDEIIKIISVKLFHLTRNKTLFLEVLKKGKYELAFKFDESLFTEENISEYKEELIEALSTYKTVPDAFRYNKVFFNGILEKNNIKLLTNGFDESLFTEEVIISIFDEIIKVYPNHLPYCLTNNKYLFNEFIKRGMLDRAFQMRENLFTKELIDANIDKLIEVLPNLLHVLNNKYIFDSIVIERKRYDLAVYFSGELYTDEFIREHFDIIISIYEKAYGSFELNRNQVIFDEFLKRDRFDLIIKLDEKFFTPEFIKDNIDKIVIALDGVTRYSMDLKFSSNEVLFNELLKREKFNMLVYFYKFITNEFIDKYIDDLIAAVNEKNHIPYGLSTNKYFLNKVIEKNRNDLIQLFDTSMFTKEFVEEHLNEIIDEIQISLNLRSNYNLFNALLKTKRYEIINQFDNSFFIPELIANDIDGIIEKMTKIPSGSSNNNYLFNEALKRKRFDLVMQFLPRFHTPEFINEYAKEILEYGSINWPLSYSVCPELLKYCLSHDIDEHIYKFDSSLFVDEILIPYYDKIVSYLKSNKRIYNYLDIESIPKFMILLEQNKEYDILNKIPFPKDILENPEKQALYAKIINISKEELVNKLQQLYNKNDEILDTILPYFLSHKFDNLDANEIEKFSIYRDLQIDLIYVDDKFLNILNRMLNILSSKDYDLCAPINAIIKNYHNYKDLISTIDINTITDEQIKNLIYLIQRKNIYNIKHIDELTDANFSNIQDQLFSKVTKDIDTTTDIEYLREMLLEKKYGLSLSSAQFIVERYYSIPEALSENNATYNLIKSISNIVKTDNIEELKFYYINSKRVVSDYYSIIALESSIRKYFAHLYSSTLYSPKESDLLNENNELFKSNPTVYNILNNATYKDKHPQIYIVKDDFRLQTHALGAYRQFDVPENFCDAWLRPKIAYHGICTTYIANNLIAPARPRHVVYGFQNYEDSALLCAGNYDLVSDAVIYNYAASAEKPYAILPPDEMIDRTRHTHNEMVIERRNNKDNSSFKRLPDYIVYFVDDINNVDNYSADNAMYQETLQASVDHNIPIVIIDRLYFAKREEKRCNLLMDNFKTKLHPTILKKLITNYINNVISCTRYDTVPHSEYHDIFTYNKLSTLMNEIIDIIVSNKRPDLAIYLGSIITLEDLETKLPRTDFQKLRTFISQNNIEYNNLVNKEDDISKKTIISKFYYESSDSIKEQIYNDLNNKVDLTEIIRKINNNEYNSGKVM